MRSALFLFVLILTLIAVNIELDIYVPAFPQMLHYFATTPSQLQWIVSINFIGVAIGCLFAGPLSDYYGRKKIIILGLLVFVIGSLGCVLVKSLTGLIVWRFIQGLGSSAPNVVSNPVIMDIYSEKKAAQFISIANSVITGSMAAAPIVGNYLTIYFNWRANFIFILIIAIISLMGMHYFYNEKQKIMSDEKVKFNLMSILKNYFVLSKNYRFLSLGIIPSLMYASIVVYIASLSLLFVNHMQVPQRLMGYYQGAVMFSFLIFSLISAILLIKINIKNIQKSGLLLITLASLFLLIIAFVAPNKPIIITLLMMLYAAGAAIALGPFITQALNTFPQMIGSASALLGALRLLLSSIALAWVGHLFNGTLLPIAAVLFIFAFIGNGLYLLISFNKK